MQVLQKKQYKPYGRISRYSTTPYYWHSLDKKYVFGTDRYLKQTTPYTSHTVVQGDTLDSLALYYYNNPTYYWMIASFNRIQDPFKELVIGSTIKIPSMSNIEFED